MVREQDLPDVAAQQHDEDHRRNDVSPHSPVGHLDLVVGRPQVEGREEHAADVQDDRRGDFVTIAFALWVGSVATVRAFYLRSLEQKIRRVAKLENVVFGDLSLRPISFHELVVEHGSLSKPVSTTTSVLVNIVVIGLITVFGVIGSFLAFQINGKWMIPIVFLMNGAFVIYALRELWVISVGGRDYVQELTQRYKKRLDRD